MQIIQDTINDLKDKPDLLQVRFYPDPILSTVSAYVTESIPHNKVLQHFLDSMVLTMQSYNAVGLAAIQVGVPLRVLVVQDERRQPIKVINPVIIESSKEEEYLQEGCLSAPGLFLKVRRPAKASVKYFDEKGEYKTTPFDGLLGRAIMHEMGHLDGKMFWDELGSDLAKRMAIEKYKKTKKKLKL